MGCLGWFIKVFLQVLVLRLIDKLARRFVK